MSKVVHFEIPIDDPERAGAFYQKVFGWQAQKWGPVDYWPLVPEEDSEPGALGALTPRSQAPEGALVYVGVDDIDAALSRVKDAGGTVVTNKMPIPSIGWSAHTRDTEGNLIGLFQSDENAPAPAD